MHPKPNLSELTFLGFYLTSALDEGLGSKVSFEEIYDTLENGTLFRYLGQKLPGTFDFSIFPPESDKEKSMISVLKLASEGYEGRERRKAGIEKSGIALLLTFVLEAIQQRDWK